VGLKYANINKINLPVNPTRHVQLKSIEFLFPIIDVHDIEFDAIHGLLKHGSIGILQSLP
jgi:hypothetical protein